MPTKQAKEFQFAGKEIFDLDNKLTKKSKDSVVLNIDADDVVISEKGKRFLQKSPQFVSDSTGFFLIDWYKKINSKLISGGSIKSEEKSNFFHLLGVMVNAGVPVMKALKSLMGQVATDSHMYLLINSLYHKIEEGQSLSEAMSYHPKDFSEMEIGMIEAGEAAGQLNATLDNLGRDIERRNDIKHKIKSALMYPVAIMLLLVAVLIVMMVFVIPKLEGLFESQGANLPLVTKIVVGTSHFLIDYKFLLIFIVGALIAGIWIGKKTSEGKYIWDKLKINFPIFGKLFKMAYIARFARSIANLVSSGVPIVKTVEITSNAIGNEVYKRRLYLTSEDIKQGIPLAETLSESSLFPPMIVNMVEVGEKTAQLDAIMNKVADYYDETVSTTVQGIAKIIEPVVLVMIGLSVGVIVAAIMLPIMQLSNMAGSF
mgnify:CR=1 FL=1